MTELKACIFFLDRKPHGVECQSLRGSKMNQL